MKTIKALFLFIYTLTFCSYGDIIYTNYINHEDFPVKITVPYYAPGTKSYKPLEIELSKGDLYEARKGRNGIVYAKYALMPDYVKEKLPKTSSHDMGEISSREKKLLMCESYSKLKRMPDEWINEKKREFNAALNDTGLTLTNTLLYRVHFKKLYSLTNLSEKAVKNIADPQADCDGDGFNNAMEAECGSNPLVYNEIAVRPSALRIDVNRNKFLTNYFYVINNSTNTYHVFLEFLDHGTYKEKFNPYLCLVGKEFSLKYNNLYYYFDIAPCCQETIAFINQSAYLPDYLSIHINCFAYKGNEISSEEVFNSRCGLNKEFVKYGDESYRILEFYGSVEPIICGYFSEPPNKPVITSPPNGSKFTNIDKVKFTWRGDKSKNSDDGRSAYGIETYVIEEDGRVRRYDFLEQKSDFRAAFINWPQFYDYFAPRVFFWRVYKRAENQSVSYSDWQYLFIGKEVAPYDPSTLRIKDKVVKHKVKIGPFNDWCYYFNNCFINYKMRCHNKKEQFKAYFIEQLPLGILEIENDDNDFYPFHLESEGDRLAVGTFTNHFVVSNGETTLTNMHIFIIKKGLGFDFY
ncbi:hypothetical protein IKW72_01085 [bacterium]|nr:hypothetical protein [bacterium]